LGGVAASTAARPAAPSSTGRHHCDPSDKWQIAMDMWVGSPCAATCRLAWLMT